MKKLYVIFGILGAVIVGYFLFFKKQVVKKDEALRPLIVGTSADYQPFSYIDPATQEIVGFDIDVISEVAKRLGRSLEIKDIPLASLIFGLLSGDIDVIAAGMSPTAKRAQVVSFSQQYIKPDPFMIIANPTHGIMKTVADLVGKKVAVNSGYTAEQYLSEKDGIDLVRLVSPADSMMALKSGAVDAFVCAQTVAQTILSKDDNASAYTCTLIPDTGDGCALAVGKNNQELLQGLNDALSSIRQDGTLEALQKKWKLA